MAYLTDEEIIEELEEIKDFLNSIGFEAEVFPELDGNGKMLVVILPTDDEDEKTAHPAIIRIIQKTEEEDTFMKYLLLYSQIDFDTTDMDELELLRCVNDFNRIGLMGSFFYSQEVADDKGMIQYKLVMGEADFKKFEEGVIGEAIIDSGIAYDRMLEALTELKTK